MYWVFIREVTQLFCLVNTNLSFCLRPSYQEILFFSTKILHLSKHTFREKYTEFFLFRLTYKNPKKLFTHMCINVQIQIYLFFYNLKVSFRCELMISFCDFFAEFRTALLSKMCTHIKLCLSKLSFAAVTDAHDHTFSAFFICKFSA